MDLAPHPPTPRSVTLQASTRLAHPSAGFIRALSWLGPGPGDPGLVHCHAQVNVPGDRRGLSAGGTGTEPDAALARAVGESLERHCIASPDLSRLVESTADDLGPGAVDPRRFVMFSPAQQGDPYFPYRPVNGASRLGWLPGYSLSHSRDVWVPATVVHLGYLPRTPADPFEQCPVSGYACGNTVEEAILAGLYEVIERDAFMLFWLQRRAAPAIDLTAVTDSDAAETLSRFGSSPLRLFCSSITTDVGVPVVLAGLTSWRPGWPAATVGAGAHLSLERALAHALRELAASLRAVAAHLARPGVRLPHHPGEVHTMEDHGLYYASPQRLPALEQLLRPAAFVRPEDVPDRSDPGDVLADLEHCVRLLARRHLEVIAVDITTPVVAREGFHVVKVLVPGAQPIDFGTRWRHLGGTRLETRGPGEAGTPGQAPTVNLLPHPFP